MHFQTKIQENESKTSPKITQFLFYCAPHVFLSLRTTQHDFGVRPSGVLIKRKLWKPADARTYWEYASGPIPEPVRCIYRWYLLLEPEILASANSSCAKLVPKRSQKSVVVVRLSRFIRS